MILNLNKIAEQINIQDYLKDVFANTLNIYGGLETKFLQNLQNLEEVPYLDKTSVIRIRQGDLLIEFSISTDKKTYNELGGLIFNGTGIPLTESLLDSTLLEMVNTLAGQFRNESEITKLKTFTQELPWIEKSYSTRIKNQRFESQWIGLFETQIGLFCLSCSLSTKNSLLETKQIPIWKLSDLAVAISPLISQGFDFFIVSGPIHKLDFNTPLSDHLDLTSVELLYMSCEATLYNNTELVADRVIVTAYKGFKTYFNYKHFNLDETPNALSDLPARGSFILLQGKPETLDKNHQTIRTGNLHCLGAYYASAEGQMGFNFNGTHYGQQLFVITPRENEMLRPSLRAYSALTCNGALHTITEAKGNKITKIDSLPALQVLKDHMSTGKVSRDENFAELPIAMMNNPMRTDSSSMSKILKVNKFNHEDQSIFTSHAVRNGEAFRFLNFNKADLVDKLDVFDEKSLFEIQIENSDRLKILKEAVVTNKIKSLDKAQRLVPVFIVNHLLCRGDMAQAGEQDLTKMIFEVKLKGSET